jgi:hypothetical protein
MAGVHDNSKKSDNKDYLIPMIDNIEQKYYDRVNVGFKFKDMIDFGFSVKTDGLFAFVEYNDLPWKYSDKEMWNLIFPYLQKKTFFAKVVQFQREPLAIQLDAKVPQFKRPELYIDDEYQGVVIKKTKFGDFIDIGYDFNWKMGSLVGLLPRKKNNPELELGEIATVQLYDIRRNNKLNFRIRRTTLGTNNEETDHLLGKIVETTKVFNPETNRDDFMVWDTYKSMMNFEKLSPARREIYKRDLDQVPDGQVISCEVIGYSKKTDQLIITWRPDIDEQEDEENQD